MKLTRKGSWFFLAVDAVQSRSHELSITFSLLLICTMHRCSEPKGGFYRNSQNGSWIKPAVIFTKEWCRSIGVPTGLSSYPNLCAVILPSCM